MKLFYTRLLTQHCCSYPQDYSKLIEDKFGKRGSKLPSMSLKDFKYAMDELVSKMRPGLSKTTGQKLLKDYSPWLSSFQAYQHTQAIEIPGEECGQQVRRVWANGL